MKRPQIGKQTTGVGFPKGYVCDPSHLLMTHCYTQAEELSKASGGASVTV